MRSCETSRSQSLLPSTGASALSARLAVSLLSEMSLTPATRLAWGDREIREGGESFGKEGPGGGGGWRSGCACVLGRGPGPR